MLQCCVVFHVQIHSPSAHTHTCRLHPQPATTITCDGGGRGRRLPNICTCTNIRCTLFCAARARRRGSAPWSRLMTREVSHFAPSYTSHHTFPLLTSPTFPVSSVLPYNRHVLPIHVVSLWGWVLTY